MDKRLYDLIGSFLIVLSMTYVPMVNGDRWNWVFGPFTMDTEVTIIQVLSTLLILFSIRKFLFGSNKNQSTE
jgi:hypothetical protein